MTWRDHARPIIAAVIAEVGTDDRKSLRSALRAAYPYGIRRYHPYRIWCHEIRVQLGEIKMASVERIKASRPCAGQRELWTQAAAAGGEARADRSILDTRKAFEPGSGYFGWMLIPEAKLATGGNP